MLIWERKADGEDMKKLMKAKLMRKTCGEKWKVNESRLPRLIQVLREQDTLLELTLIKILFKISKTNRTRYFLCYPEMCQIYNQNTAEKHRIITICEIFQMFRDDFQFLMIILCLFVCLLKRMIFTFKGVLCCVPICHLLVFVFCVCVFVCWNGSNSHLWVFHVASQFVIFCFCCCFLCLCVCLLKRIIFTFMGVSCCVPICHHMIISLDDCSLVTFHYYMRIFLFYTFLYIFLMCLYENS